MKKEQLMQQLQFKDSKYKKIAGIILVILLLSFLTLLFIDQTTVYAVDQNLDYTPHEGASVPQNQGQPTVRTTASTGGGGGSGGGHWWSRLFDPVGVISDLLSTAILVIVGSILYVAGLIFDFSIY